jgi:copper homeostasis protein
LVDLGCKGLVFGSITNEHLIDEIFLKRLSEEISFNKVDVTFHKASDYTTNLIQTYETLTKFNVPRVLTQGGILKIEENF